MRATIKNYLDAAKKRREEDGEAGFSLIELIVVVAILGILVAIAIPVFGSIQDTAKDNSAKTVAASAATQWTAQLANGEAPTAYKTGDAKITVSGMPAAGAALNSVCASAQYETRTAQTSGPGC